MTLTQIVQNYSFNLIKSPLFLFFLLTMVTSKAQSAQNQYKYPKNTITRPQLYTEKGMNADEEECFDLQDETCFVQTKPVLTTKSKLLITGNKKTITKTFLVDSSDDEYVDTRPVTAKFTYVEVETVDCKNTQTGWVREDSLSDIPRESKFSKLMEMFNSDMQCKQIPISKGNQSDLQNIAVAAGTMAQTQASSYSPSQMEDKLDKLKENLLNNKPSIGQCLLDPPNYAKDLSSKKLKYTSVVYDKVALPKLTPLQQKAKELSKITGLFITQEMITEIDSLSRTLVAEMATCGKLETEESMMGIGRAILNRKIALENKPNECKIHIGGNKVNHKDKKPLLSKIVTTPIQFSCWNPFIKSSKDKVAKLNVSGLNQTLCPVRPDTDSKCAKIKNKNSSAECFKAEKEAYDTALDVALQMVLNQKEFLRQTNSLKNIQFYTSYRDKFYTYKKAKPPTINGEVLNDRCLNFWEAPKEATKANKMSECDYALED